jgi:hypothetical protein
MNKQRLQLLLAAWCVLVIVPGVIATAGGLTADSDIGGAIVLWWIGGYLAQFFVFMVIMRMVKKNTSFLRWVVASLLPWIVDWTLPLSWLLLAPLILVAAGTAWWILTSADRAEDLRMHGIPAVGTVLKVIEPHFFNTVVNDVYIKRKLRLRIQRSDGTPPYEAIYHGTFMLGEIPDEGSRINLRVDPKNPHHFMPVSSDDNSGSGGDAGGGDSYDPAPDAGPSPDYSDGRDFTGQLEKLSALHKSGSLSDDEFTAAKERLLGLQ